MIANLNIVAKTFAKIAKTFAGLLAMIITTSRRPVLILHLEKKKSKNEIYVKNWVRSTWPTKSQQSKATVNGQPRQSKVNGDVSA